MKVERKEATKRIHGEMSTRTKVHATKPKVEMLSDKAKSTRRDNEENLIESERNPRT